MKDPCLSLSTGEYVYLFDGLLVDSFCQKYTKGVNWLNQGQPNDCNSTVLFVSGLTWKKEHKYINYYYLITMVGRVVFINFRTEQTSHYRRTICNSTSANLVSYKALTNEVWMALVTFAMTNNLRHGKAKNKLQSLFFICITENVLKFLLLYGFLVSSL